VSKKKVAQPVDPEEQAIEVHVKEIMGPAQHLDGSKPSPEEMSELEAAGLITEHGDAAIPIRVRVEPKPATKEAAAAKPDLVSSEKPETEAANPDISFETPASPLNEVQKLNKHLETEIAEGLEELDIAALGESDVTESEKVAAKIHEDQAPARSIPVTDLTDKRPVVMKQTAWQRFTGSVRTLWHTPWKRNLSIFMVLSLVGAGVFVPSVRAFVLNSAGYRSGLVVTTIDNDTTIPLGNVQVRVGEVAGKTDENGKLRLKDIPLGRHRVVITSPAYASYDKTIDIGMRVADLGEVEMKLTGQRYTYKLTDYLTERPVAGAVVEARDAGGVSDKSGKAVIAMAPSGEENTSLTVTAKGYRTETVLLPAEASQPVELKLVKSGKEVYVSKQSGRYDIYKVDFDGKNSEMLLEGTGLEKPGVSVQMSPDGKKAAVVSTRDDKRNKDGFLLSALTIVDVESGAATVINHAEALIVLGWHGQSVVFFEAVAGVSAANPARQKIMLFDTTKDKRLQLASANALSGSWLGDKNLFYIASGTGSEQTGSFMQVGYDGDSRKQISDADIWAARRTGFATYKLQTATGWLEHAVGSDSAGASTPPSETVPSYTDSPSDKQAALVDYGAPKPKLTIQNAASREQVINTTVPVDSVVRWVGESIIIFRTVSGGLAAEYIVSTEGGTPKKVVDVAYEQ